MKAYIIHLSKIPASVKSAQKLLEELSTVEIDAELFEGSYGNVVSKQYAQHHRHCHPWGIKGPDNLYNEEFKKKLSTPGVIGCFDSHYRLWQKCISLDQPIMIFEDDAHVIRPYIPVEWDEVLSLAFSHSKKMQKYLHYLESPAGNPVAASYEQSSLPGAAGYAIKPNAAKKLVDFYQYTFLPADNAVNQHVVHIQIHNYMMGLAVDREKTDGRASLIRTRIWD